MNKSILVSASQLDELIAIDDCVTVDCRFDFFDTSKGRADWLAGHIRGAVYAHLDHDLAAPIEEHTGRHPLPDPVDFARFLASAGWSDGKLLVAYDENSNAIASRLWWMMQYFGQPSALLDGGLAAWTRAGFELESGPVTPESLPIEQLLSNASMIIDSRTLQARLNTLTVLDARAGERFTGQAETLDSKAGHIPGAVNRPFGSNLKINGSFKAPAELLAEFEDALGNTDLGTLVHSCGSGVTACHNLFAMELAGLGTTRLYPGSWSEWIRDPERRIETGPGATGDPPTPVG